MATYMKWITFVADVLASIAFFGFIVAISLQIIYRYLGISIIFSEELARLLNLYAVFLGAAVAVRYDYHIRIDVIDGLLLRRKIFLRAARIFYHFVGLIFFMLLGFGSSLMVNENWGLPLATMPWLNSGHIYLAPATGSLLMFLLTIGKILGLLKDYDI